MSKLYKAIVYNSSLPNKVITCRTKDRSVTLIQYSGFPKDEYLFRIRKVFHVNDAPINQNWHIIRQIGNAVLMYKDFKFVDETIITMYELMKYAKTVTYVKPE